MRKARASRARLKSAVPQPLSAAMQGLFQHLGISTRLQQYAVLTSWDSIVGEQIARVASARKVDNGILYVDVRSASWRHELTMRKLEILEKIHRSIGKKVLKDIRFH